MKQQPPEICPVCGEDVPRKALACPECGADHNSGWREEAGYLDGTGVTDDEFDYEEFVGAEFGASPKPPGMSPLWWVTAIVVLVATAMYLVLLGRGW